MESWFAFLLLPNAGQRNEKILSQYCIEKSAMDPQKFYNFLICLKKILLNTDVQNVRKTDIKRIAQRYLSNLSPLCERFGFFRQRDVLNDICFQIISPKEYTTLLKKLSSYQKREKNIIRRMSQRLRKVIDTAGVAYMLTGRYKNIYSIYKKLQKKATQDIFLLKDIFAFRILVEEESVAQCFEILGVLHDAFSPLPERFKDYVTIPKINGYQSVHTGIERVLSDVPLSVEIQIRTKGMDTFAKMGLAAHWMYTKQKKSTILSEKEKMLLDHMESFLQTPNGLENLYCFSHERDIFLLEQGATALDFAYNVHSDLGDKAEEAIINGEKQNVFSPLAAGDIIQIIKAKEKQVQSNWLRHTSSPRSRRRIREALKLL